MCKKKEIRNLINYVNYIECSSLNKLQWGKMNPILENTISNFDWSQSFLCFSNWDLCAPYRGTLIWTNFQSASKLSEKENSCSHFFFIFILWKSRKTSATLLTKSVFFFGLTNFVFKNRIWTEAKVEPKKITKLEIALQIQTKNCRKRFAGIMS